MSLNVISGPMFSNKTSELLRILQNASRVMKVLFINHHKDDRNPEGEFSTHNPLLLNKMPTNLNIDCMSISNLKDVSVKDYDLIGIDEAQWFPDLLISVNRWVDILGKKVIVAGLDTDFRRQPFGQMGFLILQAESVTKLSSYCDECKRRGNSVKKTMFNHRISNETEISVVGGSDKYIAVCRECWNLLNPPIKLERLPFRIFSDQK